MPDIKIKLGKVYPLRFDINSLALFEEISGQSILNVIASGNLGVLAVRNMVWASLAGVFAEEGEAITTEEIGVLIQDEWIENDGNSFKDLAALVVSAMRESGLVNSKGKDDKPGKKPKSRKPRKS